MKYIYQFLTGSLFLLGQFAFAAEVPAGTQVKLDKLKLDKIFFAVNDEVVEGDKLPYGCSIEFNAEGLTGFKEESGSVFLDASIVVLETSGKELVRLDNLFSEGQSEEGLNPNDIKESLRLFLRCQTPLQLNKKYTIRFIVKDKKSSASMVVEKAFTMTIVPGAVYKESGLTSDGIFFYIKGQDKAISKNEINVKDELVWYCTGIKGFQEKDSTVLIDASIKWYDEKGKLLNEYADLFEGEEVKASDAKELLTLYFTPPESTEPGTKFKVVYTIKDKRNSKSLSSSFLFTVK